MEPESYARLVRCPILFLDATNDQHGKMDWAFKTLTSCQQTCAGRSPRDTDITSPPSRESTCHSGWTRISRGRKVPSLAESRDSARRAMAFRGSLSSRTATGPIRQVELYYAVANRNPKNRYWRSVTAQSNAGVWSASLPVLDTKEPLFAFANVTYESERLPVVEFGHRRPGRAGQGQGDRHPIAGDRRRVGRPGRLGHAIPGDRPDPAGALTLADERWTGQKDGITTTTAIPIMTHKVGDPKWRGPDGASLQFEVFVRAPRVLTVVMHEDEFGTRWTQYRKELRLTPAETWQTVTLSADEFRTEKGEPLKNWRAVDMLELESQGGPGPEPVFRAFRWVGDRAAARKSP